MRKQLVIAVAPLALGGGAGLFTLAKTGTEQQEQWGQPLGHQFGPLNPNGLPQIEACKSIKLNDPVAEAKANITKGDRRPFTVYGFTPGDVPGVFCPNGNYRMESRGGTFVSDIPDACGKNSFSNAPPDAMRTYNRTLAADPKFQEITGCRPASYCEEQYRKGYSSPKERDPKCPAEPEVLSRLAQQSDPAKLSEALQDFADRSPRSRDAITVAFIGAIGRAKWKNTEILLRAGADVNGKAYAGYSDARAWLGSPLAQVFNQNDDQAAKIPRARWLISRGADFRNPESSRALLWAASSNDIEAVNFLLAQGASVHGGYPEKELDQLAKGDIKSAGGGYGYAPTPFYAAIRQATLDWAQRSPKEIAHARSENRKGRINAVTLYRAGGRFSVGTYYDELRRKPDIKVASIILATAHREGRLEDLIERLLYPNGREAPVLSLDASPELNALIDYLQTVDACPTIRPKPMTDYVKLCASGDV